MTEVIDPKITALEALLFTSPDPLSARALAKALGCAVSDVAPLARTLMQLRNTSQSGVHVLEHDESWQMVTNPACHDVVHALAKDAPEELTPAALEAFTVVAYRGPITRAQLDAIRGVHSALALRSLLMRGLIDEVEEPQLGVVRYRISADALRYLGLHSIDELPRYQELHHNAAHERLLAALVPASSV